MERVCDHCKNPIISIVKCSTCNALFCNSKCKKLAKKDHKKCIDRPNFVPEKPKDTIVIQDEDIRRTLFGPTDEHKCGYLDSQNILQPATTPARAVEIISNHYQRLRQFYIEKVPVEASSRSTGILNLHFNDFIEMAQCYISDRKAETSWLILNEDQTEKLKSYELGQDYFGLSFTVGPKEGPYVMNNSMRFLYNGQINY